MNDKDDEFTLDLETWGDEIGSFSETAENYAK
jgi:hypothetical protein